MDTERANLDRAVFMDSGLAASRRPGMTASGVLVRERLSDDSR
jgi:hypothetical protein